MRGLCDRYPQNEPLTALKWKSLASHRTASPLNDEPSTGSENGSADGSLFGQRSQLVLSRRETVWSCQDNYAKTAHKIALPCGSSQGRYLLDLFKRDPNCVLLM